MSHEVATGFEEEPTPITFNLTEEEIHEAAFEILKALTISFPRALELAENGLRHIKKKQFDRS